MSAPPPGVFYVNCGLLLSALELCAHVSLSNQLQCLFYFSSSTLEGVSKTFWACEWRLRFQTLSNTGGWSWTSSRSSCGIPPSRNPCVPRLVSRPKPPWCSSKYFAGNIGIQRQLTASRPKGNLEQTKSFLLWPPREEGKYPEEVTFKKPIATASVFCGRVDKRFDYLAGDRKLARHACESLYSQVECAGIERLENSFSSCCCCDKVGREELAKQRFLIFFGQQIK